MATSTVKSFGCLILRKLTTDLENGDNVDFDLSLSIKVKTSKGKKEFLFKTEENIDMTEDDAVKKVKLPKKDRMAIKNLKIELENSKAMENNNTESQNESPIVRAVSGRPLGLVTVGQNLPKPSTTTQSPAVNITPKNKKRGPQNRSSNNRKVVSSDSDNTDEETTHVYLNPARRKSVESQVSQSSSRGALGRGHGRGGRGDIGEGRGGQFSGAERSEGLGGGKIGRGRAKRSLGQFFIQPKKRRSRKSF